MLIKIITQSSSRDRDGMQVVYVFEELLHSLGFRSDEADRLNFRLQSHKLALNCVLARVFAVFHEGRKERLYRRCVPHYDTAEAATFFFRNGQDEISVEDYFAAV